MHISSLVIGFVSATLVAGECKPYPPSMVEYSYGFEEPLPPKVKFEFQTHFVQHKWDANKTSHIGVGYMYNSPKKQRVRVDSGNEFALASSIFDFKNTTTVGGLELVNNIFTNVFDPKNPAVWEGYSNSNYPLVESDFLTKYEAVFVGLVERPFLTEKVSSWSLMYPGDVALTVFVDKCGAVVGYDYFSPYLRTRVTTSFFNTHFGEVDF